jgi:hypothetical protein
MSEIKIMVVPGKIARVELSASMTLLMACEQAERQLPGVGWLENSATRPKFLTAISAPSLAPLFRMGTSF